MIAIGAPTASHVSPLVSNTVTLQETFLRRYLSVGTVIAVGCVLSALATVWFERLEHATAEARFERAAFDRISAIRQSIDADLDVVRSVVSLYAASQVVDRDEFRAFVQPALAQYQSIQALEWIPRVPAAERQAYEEGARREGIAGFQITERGADGAMEPAADRAEYFPVYFVQPLQGNERAVGFDLASNATRRAALERARDSGEMQASGRITLVQETGSQAGLLIFAPVYRNAAPRGTVEERRESLVGFVLSVFRIGDMIGTALSDLVLGRDMARASAIDLHVYDEDGEPGARLLYASVTHAPHGDDITGEEPAPPGLEQSVAVAGRQWNIVATPLDPDFDGGGVLQPWTVAVVGLAFTILVATYLTFHLNRARAIQRLVGERTAELRSANAAFRESEARTRTVLETAADGIVTLDERGMIEAYNPASESLFGHTAAEATGRPLSFLMPPLAEVLNGPTGTGAVGERLLAIAGDRREILGRHKSGKQFPVELTISDMTLAAGRKFTGWMRDITERKQVERLKNEFISTVSHELRTPLTSINASLGLVADGVTGDIGPEATDLVDIARRNADRLVRLINDILDIEKIESGGMEYVIAVLPLRPLVDQAVEANRAYAAQLGVDFTVTDVAPDTFVRVDADRLIQVLTNLMSNAAKFSPHGDSVEVFLSGLDGAVRVAITDHGGGIPEGFRARVFQKFAQADSSSSRRKSGTGLGLSICRAIIDQLGGRIGFETEVGAGTTFYFELPTCADHAPAPAVDASLLTEVA